MYRSRCSGRAASAHNWRGCWDSRSHSRRTLPLSTCTEQLSYTAKNSAVQVIAAETDAAARRLFTTPQQRFLRLIRNQPVELLPPGDSMEPLWNDIERAAVENKLRAAIVGSDATVKAGLQKLVNDTAADEVIVVTDTYEHADRIESYRRVAAVARMIEVKAGVAIGAEKLERTPGRECALLPKKERLLHQGKIPEKCWLVESQ